MNLWGRVKAAARTLWRGPVSEATLEEIYGRPVPWADLYTVNGRYLVPALTYGPEPRKERNATLRTLQDHDRARNSSRVLAETNPNAIGLLQRLQAYNVGKGSSTEVQAVKEDAEPPKRLAAKVRDFIKQFKRANRWTQREREMVLRLHVDGEFFLRFFPQKDGTTKVRFVEPQNVRPPGGFDHEGEWSYGIQTPGGDAEEPEAYCVRDFQTGTDEIVEAQFVIHVKTNCLSNQKRGVPSLYAVEEELRGSARLRYATREGEKNRASITYFRRHKAATRDAIERAFHDPSAASALEGLGPAPDNPSTTYVEAIEPGSVVDIPDGLDPLPPPGSPNTEGGSRSVQQALEAVAARFGCPYWIASGDSGATNFAASLTAESPFTVTIQDSQADLAEVSDAAQTKAIEIGAEQGLLPEDVLEQIDLLVSFPSPVSRNKKEETDRRKVLHDANVMSETTWMTEEGLDPDKQRQQMREERADPILPLPTRVSSVPVDPRTGAPYNPPAGGGNGKAPSGTPAARYAQLAGRLREQAEALDLLSLAEAGAFDESKHPRDEGGKFGAGGGGAKAPEPAKAPAEPGAAFAYPAGYKPPSPRSAPSAKLPEQSRPALSAPEAAAVDWYAADGYRALNAALYQGASLSASGKALEGVVASVMGGRGLSGRPAQTHRQLQAAFAKAAVLPEPVEVTRGLSFPAGPAKAQYVKRFEDALASGGVVKMAGYQSATVGGQTTGTFDDSSVVLSIAAVKGLDVGPYSLYHHESELLLDHGSAFRVRSVTQNHLGQYRIELEQLLPSERNP